MIGTLSAFLILLAGLPASDHAQPESNLPSLSMLAASRPDGSRPRFALKPLFSPDAEAVSEICLPVVCEPASLDPDSLGLIAPFAPPRKESRFSIPTDLLRSIAPAEKDPAGIRDAPASTASGDDQQSSDTPPRPQFPANGFLPLEPVAPATPLPPKVQWRELIGGSLRYLGVMHSFRIATEAGTRSGLKDNPFWGGYLAALGAMHGWSDGDGYYENYLGHPIQGAVSGYLWIHNDPRFSNVEFGRDPNYWKSRLRATAFAWAFSAQFEVGLISEASIGQIQRYCCQYGFVDHIITPTGGIVWMVAEDALDRYAVRRIEDSTNNLGIRIAARLVLNPSQSFANLMNMEYPWYRENRGAPSRYERNSFVPVQRAQSESGDGTVYPLIPKFEIAATLPSVMNIGGLSCLGGGGVAGFKVSDNWQWTAEISGCTLGNSSLPQNWSGDSLTFTTGPQWIRHTESRWSPHAHLRLGGQKITEQDADPQKRQAITNLLPPGAQLNPYYDFFTTNYESTALSLSLGGGLDYRLYPGLALRVASLDYVHSWLDPVHGTDFNSGVRFTTGVVLRLGTW